MDKKDILNFTLKEFEQEFQKLGFPAYRVKQIFGWIYKKGVFSFDSMKNLPKNLISALSNCFEIALLKEIKLLQSNDGTEKALLGLIDRNIIETVLIHSKKRETICLSTQIGCKYRCLFCASGKNGFIRNLTVSEILAQILYFQHIRGYNISNYVFMGIGEPLDNYENLSRAIRIMNSPDCMRIGARRITVSTSGVVPGINRLKELGLEINLSVSLHSADDKLRNELMPINKKYPLSDLSKACEDFFKTTGRLITIEYIVLKGVNDGYKSLKGLVDIAKRWRAKVNLIGYNKVRGVDFDIPIKGDMQRILDFLLKNKVNVTMRQSKGADISSACGQLAYRM